MQVFTQKLLRTQVASTESLVRSFAGTSSQSFKLPDLPYDYNALEPVISARIMELHHTKHHATYVTNLNANLEKRDNALAKGDLAAVVQFDGAIKFNGGGHVNHSIFWKNLAPISKGGGNLNKGSLSDAINKKWENLSKFQETFNTTTVAIQGSGWGWLVYSTNDKALKIMTTANQDPVGSNSGIIPLLGIDVWEHAYYLKYENRRADYLKEIWKVVNWEDVQKRYDDCHKK